MPVFAEAARLLVPILSRTGINACETFRFSEIEQIPQPLRNELFQEKDRLYIPLEEVCGDPTCGHNGGYADIVMNGKFAHCPTHAAVKKLTDTARYRRWGLRIDVFFTYLQKTFGLPPHSPNIVEGFVLLGVTPSNTRSELVAGRVLIYTTARKVESSNLALSGLDLVLGGRPALLVTERLPVQVDIPAGWMVQSLEQLSAYGNEADSAATDAVL